jgi:hypothetical protein
MAHVVSPDSEKSTGIQYLLEIPATKAIARLQNRRPRMASLTDRMVAA